MSDNAKFQDTKVFQETYVKVMLRNLDKIEHSVSMSSSLNGGYIVWSIKFWTWTLNGSWLACFLFQVQAEVKSGPFAVRHRQFTIKSGHYINIPVYFKPLKSGLSTGQLQLTVLKDKVLLLVSLSGRTLPWTLYANPTHWLGFAAFQNNLWYFMLLLCYAVVI